jgi:hypothetical protein
LHRELGVVPLHVLEERLGVLAADEELDGVFRLGAHDGVDVRASTSLAGGRTGAEAD